MLIDDIHFCLKFCVVIYEFTKFHLIIVNRPGVFGTEVERVLGGGLVPGISLKCLDGLFTVFKVLKSFCSLFELLYYPSFS